MAISVIQLIYLSHINTIKYHKEFINLKTINKYVPLMGADEFMTSTVSLNKQSLNLGAWQGYHELTLKEDIDIKDIEIQFTTPETRRLELIFKTDQGEYLLRVTNSKLYPSIFTKLQAQRFTEKKRLNIQKLIEKNTLKVEKNNQVFVITLNNKIIHRFSPKYISNIVLKGSQSTTTIKNIKINDNVYSFSIFHNWQLSIIPSLCALIILLIIISLMSRYTSKDYSRSLLLFYINIALTTYFAYHFYVQAGRYPETTKESQIEEELLIKNEFARIEELINKSNIAPRLFIGSSQTFGEGASTKKETWVNQLCQNNCINSGIRSATTQDFLDNFKIYQNTKFSKVFINLAYNDTQSDTHSANMRKLVQEFKQISEQVILIIEPYNTVFNKLSINQENIVNTCQEAQIKCINPMNELTEKYDSGFIWWDMIHLTDYGQKLMADIINKSLRQNY